MITIAATLEGQDEVSARFVQAGDRVREAARDEMWRLANETAERMGQGAPRRRGRLRSTIKFAEILNTPDAIRIDVRPDKRRGFYGLFLETGISTTTKVPRPYVRRKAGGGRFAGERGAAAWANLRSNWVRNRMSGAFGEMDDVVRVVRTSPRRLSFPAQPFAAPAREATARVYTSRIQAAINKAVAGA